MSEVIDLVAVIQKRINKMVQVLHSFENENHKLKEKQAELLQTIEHQNNIIKELKDKNNSIILSDTIKQTEGSSEVKKQIDEMVREIDRCIELLNN